MRSAFAAAVFAALSPAFASEKVYFDELDLSGMTSGWGEPVKNATIDRKPFNIAGRGFSRGVGTHALSCATFKLGGDALSFDADVGLDMETKGMAASYSGSVRFRVFADGRQVFVSPAMTLLSDAVHVHVDLKGVDEIELVADDANDGEGLDHADWCDAFFTMKDGTRPQTIDEPPPEQLGILTPPESAEPRINGARIFGVRPGHPVIWRLPATGARPMKFSASGLPEGVRFDAETGILSGSVAKAGDYRIVFHAENAHGRAKRDFTLAVGDRIALTPPMGWNSWNCFAGEVTAKDIRAAADAFIASGLADHGWSYVNIDDCWQFDEDFPDMGELADYIHSKGLKAGLYSSPGPTTCGGRIGSWAREWLDAKTYASWGYDYLKYDWCSYDSVAVGENGLDRLMLPYMLMGEALAAQNRDIVYSLCQYGIGGVATWGARAGGNAWRTTYDIVDTWPSVRGILSRQAELWPFAGPGGWNDPDMLVVGTLGWGEPKPTRLTPNEQYTHVSMWAIACAPLLIGCDLSKLDDFTRSLLCNDEVIETNQDPLGAAAAIVAKGPRAEIWAKPMGDGSIVFAMFNTFRRPVGITIEFSALGMEGKWAVRDLWSQEDLGIFSNNFTSDTLAHATRLVRLRPVEGGRMREGFGDIRMNSVYSRFEAVRPVGKPGYSAPERLPCADCPKLRRH
ncbi:MAG: NPCBM/NEW2 domain-containing protein [Kiritimatiellae bacterium]|nr:NPCBM/NEW2 domain-containing protein [Kiritimatiellia bacterium]